MNKKLQGLLLVSVTLVSGLGFAQTRYVSTTGSDASNDCQTPGNPCGTIAHAYTEITAGDTIKLAPGIYNLGSTLSITESVVITALDPQNKPEVTSSVSTLIDVNSDDVTISNVKFTMGLTASTGLKGIVSTNQFDNLKLINNEFESVNPLTAGAMVFGAYAVQLNTPVGDVQNVTITGNRIWADLATSNMFGRGLGIGISTLDGPGGVIANNDITAYYPIQAIRTSDDLTIEDNQFNGMLMINYPLTDVNVSIDNNTISGVTQLTPANLYSLTDIRAIEVGNVSITNNTFEDFQNVGILSMASKNVTIEANTFNPLSSATTFTAIMANTKLMTNGVQGNTFSDEVTIIGNTFNAGVTGQGSAITFADHYGVNTPAFAAITVGGETAEEKNTFNANLGSYIVLDQQTGASTSYALWAPYPATTMVPFAQDVEALITNNNYNQTTIAAIQAKNQDDNDNAALGKILLTAEDDNRYVAVTGDDQMNDCTLPGFPCATIAHAITVAQDNDSVIVAAGNYALTTVLSIDQDGLTITAADEAALPVITTNQATVFDINATDVTINALRLELGLTAATGNTGILSTANNYDGLTVKNSKILSTSPVIPYGMVWNAFAIQLNSPAGTDSITIINNEIGVAGASNIFGRGIRLGNGATPGPAATITGNTVMSYYTVQAISSTGDVWIEDNELNGILMVNAPVSGVTVTVMDNEFSAATPMTADSLYALVEVRSVENAAVVIAYNNFDDYTRLALISEASKNVNVLGNVFNPAETAEDFISLMVNTKLMTNGVQGNTYADEIVIQGNEFTAGAANEGTAIVFADHFGTNVPAFGAIVIGGDDVNEKNEFDVNLGNYIVLDDQDAASSTNPFWAAYPSTPMKPVSQNIEALYINNTYNLSGANLVEVKNIDSLDNQILGKVILAYDFTNVNELTEEVAKVYPNPTVNDFTITLKNNTASADVTVVDVFGKVVYTATFNGTTTIDATALTNGVYIVNLNVNGTVATTRIVKN